MRDGEIDGMQDFDTVILRMIENKTITLDDGLSFATNQNNLLLQLRGLASTEDFINAAPKPKMQPTSVAAPPPPNSANSVLNMIE
jgi:Tfp pilus assembly ATPase PilU